MVKEVWALKNASNSYWVLLVKYCFVIQVVNVRVYRPSPYRSCYLSKGIVHAI